MPRRRFLSITTVLCAALVTTLTAQPSTAAPGAGHSAGTLDVQTYNLDLGADLTPLFGATDIASLRSAATGVYADVEASRPEERMRAVAVIIARHRPDVVGALPDGGPVPGGGRALCREL